MPKLTKSAIDALPTPTKGDAWLWCSEVPGFGVRAQASGRKVYVARYRTQDGTQRKQVLARVCDMAPEQARQLARKTFSQVAEGKDPMKDKQESRTAPTMQELRDKFQAEHSEKFKKASSQDLDERNWRLYVLPTLGAATRVRAIEEADILRLKGKLADKPATANQCLALLSKAFNLAEKWKMRPAASNPCKGVTKFVIDERELILTPAQIGAMNTTITEMVQAGELKPEFAAFIRLLALTGCRKCEIMHARKDWIDTERGLLLLPDSKTRQKKVALSLPALEIAAKLLESEGEWLIPGRRTGQPLQSPYKVWAEIKARAKLPKELRLHDLRHTAGSLAHMAGATQREVAKMLGHKQLSTTERYLHGFAGDAHKTAGVVAEVIGKAMEVV